MKMRKKDFVSCFLSFKNAYARGGEWFDYPAGDAFFTLYSYSRL